MKAYELFYFGLCFLGVWLLVQSGLALHQIAGWAVQPERPADLWAQGAFGVLVHALAGFVVFGTAPGLTRLCAGRCPRAGESD